MNIHEMRAIVEAYDAIGEMDELPQELYLALCNAFNSYLKEHSIHNFDPVIFSAQEKKQIETMHPDQFQRFYETVAKRLNVPWQKIRAQADRYIVGTIYQYRQMANDYHEPTEGNGICDDPDVPVEQY